jgi:hypothetical protein
MVLRKATDPAMCRRMTKRYPVQARVGWTPKSPGPL